jgi:hypothetical protein
MRLHKAASSWFINIIEFLMSVFDKDSSTLGRYAVSNGKLLETFRGESILHLFVLPDHENGGITIVQNTGRNLPIDTA